MLTFRRENGRFIYRVAGIAFHEDRVLLHRVVDEDYWAVPGGRCEMMETSRETLIREMKEELGIEVRVKRLLWVVENFYHYDRCSNHELGFYYLMEIDPMDPICKRDTPFLRRDPEGVSLVFQWHPVVDLEELTLYPSFLRKELRNPPEVTQHWVHRDVDH